MAGDLAQFERIMRDNFASDRVEEIRREDGKIMGFLRDPSLDKGWHGKSVKIPIETKSPHNFHYAYDGEPLGNAGSEEMAYSEWNESHFYGFATWSNISTDYTKNSDTSMLSLDVYRTMKTAMNGMAVNANALYGAGGNEVGWISVASNTTNNVYSAGTLTWTANVGGSASGTTPDGKYWYNPNLYAREGMYVDVVKISTGLPYADARNMLVESVTHVDLDTSPHSMTLSGMSAAPAALAAQDMIVLKGTIDSGESAGSAGWNKSPWGLIAMYAPTDIVTSLTTRYVGNISKDGYSFWRPATFKDCEFEPSTNLFDKLFEMAWAIENWGFNPDTLIVHPNVAKAAYNAEKSDYTYNDTRQIAGGFKDVTYHLGGGISLQLIVDTGCPAGRAFMFDSSTLGYSVRNPFGIIDGPKNQAVSGGFDRTAVRFREDSQLILRNPKGGAMMIDIV